ncbi:hypothetical protein THRCLA_05815 [Thraustotheca clavata]|uniref:Uncharacterized protein n=1 Tax=Thraustotheca clavata TaxID=74557 RepID=A0A1V9ZSE4_9STRA|nr:hypothetical protein THRCLA_05815 [Thraustotheca clavata]
MSLDGHEGLGVTELEMDIGDDIFSPSAYFHDELLDSMALDNLSFVEFGPFPSNEKKTTSFIHSDEMCKSTSLPPKYFKRVDSSPEKRRMISRTLSQIKTFSFDKKEEERKVVDDEEECKPTTLTTPKRRVLVPSPAPLVTPVFIKREMNEMLSPTKKEGKKLINWTPNASPIGTLPPRYYRGPDTSPEKKRAHSTIFGRVSSFTFDKIPKRNENNIIKRAYSIKQ